MFRRHQVFHRGLYVLISRCRTKRPKLRAQHHATGSEYYSASDPMIAAQAYNCQDALAGTLSIRFVQFVGERGRDDHCYCGVGRSKVLGPDVLTILSQKRGRWRERTRHQSALTRGSRRLMGSSRTQPYLATSPALPCG